MNVNEMQQQKTLNIVIPMAGAGSRFAKAGYTDPKPLIPINGKPMIEWVVDNLRPACPHKFIFICQKAHMAQYGLRSKLEAAAPGCEIVEIEGITDGAACTVLKAAEFFNNENALMIANSDQYIDCSIDDYLKHMEEQQLNGLIMTMKADDPKWSFVGFDTDENVSRVVEKEVISDEATVGIYNFDSGADFVRAAEDMIAKDERVNGEFYVAPAYNNLLAEGGYKIGVYNIGEERDGMYGLGIPDDLDFFLSTKLCKTMSKAG